MIKAIIRFSAVHKFLVLGAGLIALWLVGACELEVHNYLGY